jgi:hypothetical protein
MRQLNDSGIDWYTLGAQKGVAQPAYVIRWRGDGKKRIRGSHIKWLENCQPCDCGLRAGEVRDGRH